MCRLAKRGLNFKLGHDPISEVDGRSRGNLVGGKGWLGLCPSLFRSVFGLAIGETPPSLARSRCG